MEALSIPALFAQTSTVYSKQDAIRFLGKTTTFEQLDTLSNSVANKLRDSGIKNSDRIALYCINSDMFAIAYLGIIKAGATVVPLNLLQTPSELTYILNDSGASAIFYHELFSDTVSAFRDNTPTLNTHICIGDTASNSDDLTFSEILKFESTPLAVNIDPLNDLAAILYTSGTTGKPKGAMLTHHNLASNTNSVLKSISMTPGKDVLVAVLPMFHAFAATVAMLTPMLRGLTMLPVVKFDAELLANSIKESGGTILFAVPSMYNALLNMNDEQVGKLTNLRYCVSGGAAMPEEVMKQFENKFGLKIYEGYGPTECSPVTNVNPIGGTRKILSVGLPVADVELCIKDTKGNDLPNDEVGEICVKGPNVMKGYWMRDDETKKSFFGDWFRTGDLGKKDDDGYYYIVDRIKDMIIVNGMNVYPRIVEEILYQHPQIKECAVIGLNDSRHGEIVAAYIVTVNGEEISASEVRKFCQDKLGRYQIPKKVITLEELPKNATGKILKRELKTRVSQETA